MCGFTGFWSFKGQSSESLTELAYKMAAPIAHRGPDSTGVWVESSQGLAFAHQRLAIVDLSPAGHQPMTSHSGRFTIIYNGEIYNAPALRESLAKHQIPFRGSSDTEVILEACEAWGVQEAASQFIGMFTFALWDHKIQKLYLVRDRLGIKPLYWGFNQGTLFFGSQLKSFKPHPHFSPEIDNASVVEYFRYAYVPAPRSIFKNIYKITPGTIIEITNTRATQEYKFWDLHTVATEGLTHRSHSNDKEAITSLEELLKDAVHRRMIADVPLGAFLSGGIDSSLVVALMQAQNTQPVKTFTIGFEEEGYNEAPYAQKIAKHLKTEHHELYISPHEALDVVPQLPEWFDEPFADSSQIPTYLVSKLARQHVTVSLSGDGGDELFAGYNRYLFAEKIWNVLGWVPTPLRRLISQGMDSTPLSYVENLAKLIPYRHRPNNLGEKFLKTANLLSCQNKEEVYQNLVTYWPTPEKLLQEPLSAPFSHQWTYEIPQGASYIERMQFLDTLTYLPDDILTKVDRASMAVSLEARVPLLDHRVVAFAWSLPNHMKIRDGKSKWLLRQVLSKYVPSSLFERPKMGFGIPLGPWLRGPLQSWGEDLLDPQSIQAEGLLNANLIQEQWQAHKTGTRQLSHTLWVALMFQAWRRHWNL